MSLRPKDNAVVAYNVQLLIFLFCVALAHFLGDRSLPLRGLVQNSQMEM